MPLIGVVTHLFPLTREVFRGNAIYQTVRALRSLADIKVLYPQPSYPGKPIAARTYEWDGLSVTDIPYPAVPFLSRPVNGKRVARAIYPYLKELNCDVILSYWIYPDGYAAVEVGKALNTPVIVASRGSDLRRIPDPFMRSMVARAVRHADYVLTVSDDLRQRAIALGAHPERSRSILNGCDHQVFRYAGRDAARGVLNLSPDAQIVLYVGRLVADKGILDLVAAFSELARERPQLQLALIGGGPLEGKLQQFASRPEWAGRVLRCGPQRPAAVAQWMQAADVFCLPSYSEGCPNVVIESISSGCPVVATDVGGVPELLHRECGVMVPAAEPAKLAEGLRSCLGRNWNREHISAAFTRTWDDAAAETWEVCRSLVRPPAPAVRKRRPDALRIAVVTPYFPTSEDSYRGHSALHTIRHLLDMTEVEVICPLTAYLLGGLTYHGTHVMDRSYRPAGIPTSYFEYPAIPLLSRPVNGLICERYLYPHLERFRPDLILNYWLYPEGFAAVRAARTLGIPVVVGSIGSDLRRIPDRFSRAMVRRTVTAADAVITVSEDLRRRAIAMGAAPGKVTTILNGCDTTVFHPGERQAARRAAGADPDQEVLLYVGSLLESKGLNELVEAFRAVSASRSNVRLYVIGEGPYREEVKRRAAAAGVADRMTLLGRQPSATVAEWMRAADVFCLPSHSEGCPNVIIEALASGMPIVASNVGGIPELVNRTSGILVPPQQPSVLRDALLSALAQDWDTAAIATSFRRGWQEVAEETFRVCRGVFDASRRPAAEGVKSYV
jgi:teichuronic acid biosynthesis glycosyltransferase TuaC